MEDKIKAAIFDAIDVTHLEVVNESHYHAGHAGDDGSGETHFKIKVISTDFSDLSRVQRQRLLNTALKSCFDEGLHAVSMQLEVL